MNDLLTHLEHAGASGVLAKTATLAERSALAIHLAALKAQHHAIVADEVMESGEASGDIMVWHYLSCVRCKEGAL
jgi:hypothetical protein